MIPSGAPARVHLNIKTRHHLATFAFPCQRINRQNVDYCAGQWLILTKACLQFRRPIIHLRIIPCPVIRGNGELQPSHSRGADNDPDSRNEALGQLFIQILTTTEVLAKGKRNIHWGVKEELVSAMTTCPVAEMRTVIEYIYICSYPQFFLFLFSFYQ